MFGSRDYTYTKEMYMENNVSFGLNPVNVVENIFGDGIAKVEYYDFSRANLNEENRLHAVTSVASICYQNPKSIDSKSLYDRLAGESIGLPSSSYEMVPVLIEESIYMDRVARDIPTLYNPLTKFGLWIKEMGKNYLLTNFRAIHTLYDISGIDLRDLYNTEEECDIISRYYCIFKLKIDTNTRTQLIRHRILNAQELSRRYVSGKKVPILFYLSKKLKEITSRFVHRFDNNKSQALDFTTQDVHDICLNHYTTAIENGVKPQEARRILPQSMYTDIWIGFDRYHFKSFINLRTSKSAQYEIRAMATAMKYLSTLPLMEVLINNISLTEKHLEDNQEKTEQNLSLEKLLVSFKEELSKLQEETIDKGYLNEA